MTLKTNNELSEEDKFKTYSAKIQDFSELLDSIESLSEKKKSLWKDIYSNAIYDRNNANILLTSLLSVVINNSNEHAIHGQNINKYIERMSKSNDQLIKLAELIQNAEEQSGRKKEDLSEDDIYAEIAKK